MLEHYKISNVQKICKIKGVMFQGLEPCTFSYNQTLQFSSITMRNGIGILAWYIVFKSYIDNIFSKAFYIKTLFLFIIWLLFK